MTLKPIKMENNKTAKKNTLSKSINNQLHLEDKKEAKPVEKPMPKLDKQKLKLFIIKWLHYRRYFDAILVRLIFLAIPSYHIYLLYCLYNAPLYFLLYSYYIIIILDGTYVVWKRGGRDYYW